MRKMVLGMLVFLCIGILGTSSLHAGVDEEMKEKARPVTQADLTGTWRMTFQVVHPEIKKRAPQFFVEHQVFEFRDGGLMKTVSASEAFDDVKAKTMLQKAWSESAQIKYSFINEGVLAVQRSEKDGDRMIAAFIKEDMTEPFGDKAPILKKGELLLTYFMPNNQPYMQRVLKKIA